MEYLRSDSDGEGETLSDSRPVRLCGCDSPKHTVGVLALSEHTANQGFCKSASCASCPGAENQRPRPRRLILRRPARRPATQDAPPPLNLFQDLLNRGDTSSLAPVVAAAVAPAPAPAAAAAAAAAATAAPAKTTLTFKQGQLNHALRALQSITGRLHEKYGGRWEVEIQGVSYALPMFEKVWPVELLR